MIAPSSRTEDLGIIDFDHIAEQLGVLAECEGIELIDYEPDLSPYDSLNEVIAPRRA